MATTSMTMRGLLNKLGAAGISSAFAKRMLPTWWDDEIAADPAGMQQAQLYLARAFNIDLRSLAEAETPIRFRANVRKFKLSKNVSEEAVSVGAHYATGVARVALQGHCGDQQAPPADPLKLREAILAKRDSVNLVTLLEWCCGAGIPVLHIETLPGKKMTGLVVRDGGRFAVVLSKKGHPAHLAFYLAHELGHIAKGHISADGFVADESIDTSSLDVDEREADAYAVWLLNGADVRYRASGAIRNAKMLYQAALVKSRQARVDPGHIIANYGHHQSLYPMANAALKLLGPPQQGGDVVNAAFFSAIRHELLSDDQIQFLKVATARV